MQVKLGKKFFLFNNNAERKGEYFNHCEERDEGSWSVLRQECSESNEEKTNPLTLLLNNVGLHFFYSWN